MANDDYKFGVCNPADAVKEQLLTLSASGKPVPANISYFNTGCMTYNSLSAARASAESLHSFLKDSGYGGTITVA